MMSFPHHNTIQAFHRRLLAWYGDNGRMLPWRPPAVVLDRHGAVSDPYAVLVSEIMLQQTQVERVQEKWPVFLQQFPTARALANASRGDVLRAWQGMGYNRRALNLQRAAREIVEEHCGTVPRNREALRALPGVGDYTASAVRVFVFNVCDLAVDVNVRRVLGRHLFGGNPPISSELRAQAGRLVPEGRARDYHNALMDLGSLSCTANVEVCTFWRCTSLRDVHRQHRRRKEPTHRGTPRRIWRGRVVEILREANGGLHWNELVQTVFEDNTQNDRQFLKAVVYMLREEAMVIVRNRIVSLPG